jgi:hypothetical protein
MQFHRAHAKSPLAAYCSNRVGAVRISYFPGTSVNELVVSAALPVLDGGMLSMMTLQALGGVLVDMVLVLALGFPLLIFTHLLRLTLVGLFGRRILALL